jgi:hypothetical protein
MYSYVIEFNLAQRGDDAQEFLADAARTWPKLWGDIPGVTGTLLLSSAFALGGEFDYQLRVDLESLSTLSRIDEALKSDNSEWVRARTDWFRSRVAARAHLSEHVAGDDGYLKAEKSADAAVHLVLHSGLDEGQRTVERVQGNDSVSGLVSAQTGLRLQSLDNLDSVAAAGLNVSNGRLFGELREVDGSLFAGA